MLVATIGTRPEYYEVILRLANRASPGATSAMEGEYGIIPGSMGVGSFIVQGKGNPDSWSSCSHGAGRRMSRTKAFANVTQEDFVRSMEGIVCDTNEDVRDEAPAAYKDLATVMANQVSSEEKAVSLNALSVLGVAPRSHVIMISAVMITASHQ